MINFKEAEKEFIKYSEKFDINEEHLKRRQLHSLRVRDISRQIAKNMSLSDENVEIATLIGLLHDIARFDQFTQYGTFKDDKSVDHGNLGAEILNKNNYINKYLKDEKYKNIVLVAIKNHNKYKIEDNLNKEEEMFCKIIRDADKIDIFYEVLEIFYNEKDIEETNQTIISDNIIDEFYKKKLINKRNFPQRGPLIRLLIILAFIFDINYKESYEIIWQRQYIDEIFEKFNFKDKHTKNKMEEIRMFLNQYICNCLGKVML